MSDKDFKAYVIGLLVGIAVLLCGILIVTAHLSAVLAK